MIMYIKQQADNFIKLVNQKNRDVVTSSSWEIGNRAAL